MFDITAASVVFFRVVLFLLWVVVLFGAYQLGRRTVSAYRQKNPNLSPPVYLWVGWVGFVLIALSYSSMESAYRPKTVIIPINPALTEKLEKVERGERPEVKPALPDRPSWEEQQKKNRDENQKAREEFEKLPPR